MRPDPDITSRGDAASSSAGQELAAQRRAGPSADRCPSSAANRSSTRTRTSYLGTSNVPVPVAVNCSRPDSGARGKATVLQRFDRNLGAVSVERIRAVPSDPRRAGHAAGALANLKAVEPHARIPRSEARRWPCRTSRRMPCRCRSRAGRTRTASRTCRTGGIRPDTRPVDRIHVELEGMPQIRKPTTSDEDARVDFLAVVAPRIAERERAVGSDLRRAVGDDALADDRVAVLDHDLGGAAAPHACPTPACARRVNVPSTRGFG